MANYIIEGIISELSFDEGYFTICGSEGFAIKQGDKKYNVLCPEEMSEQSFSTQRYSSNFILKQDFKLSTKSRNENILLQGFSLQKKVRIRLQIKYTIEKEELKIEGVAEPLSVSSITLLSD